jgi:pectate lyase
MPHVRPVRDAGPSRTPTPSGRSTKGRLLAVLSVAVVATLAVFMAVVPSASAATLFSDNFEDGNADGWSKSGGDWSVLADGSQAYRQSNLGSELARAFGGSTSWTNYTVQARVKPLAFDGSGRYVGISARTSGATKFYRLALLNNNRAELQAVNGSSVTVIGGVSRTVSVGTWYTLRIDVSGSTISGFVNGAAVASGNNTMEDNGRIALQTFHATASFDDVIVSDTVGTPPTTSSSTSTSTRPPTTTTRPPTPTTQPPTVPPQTGLVGWATQNGGTSGGAGGATVNVNTASAFLSAINSSSPAVIRLSGTITLSGMNPVASNKTILGVGSNATIVGGGLTMSNDRNIIIRNINFRDWDDDAINIETSSTNIWVDHNSFTNGNDGAVDIKRGSDFITVSWNRTFGHDKTMLLGHSDDNASQDVGHLRVTYHHNWFDGSGTRHPRTRFGNPVHVYNNYYFNNEYGVASTMGGGVLVEGNYFENVDDPTLVGYADSDPGAVLQRNNVFVGSGTPQSGGGSVAGIPYSYQLDNANNVRSIVMSGAGTGRIAT